MYSASYETHARDHHPGFYNSTYRRNPSPTPQQLLDAQSAGRAGLSLINKPISFVEGQHAGQTVRAELEEVQKADLGRKYARVDRRPLDPPPAVLLKFFYVYNAGTNRETEREIENYDNVQNIGLLCNVDLFPVPGPSSKDVGWKRHEAGLANPISFNTSDSPPHSPQRAFTFVASNPYPPASQSLPPIQPLHVPTQSMAGYLPTQDSAQDVVSHIGDYPITEGSKQTSSLVGATFVQPATVDYRGKKALMFVFADLAVKTEGNFILRYRAFDIFSKAHGSTDLVVQAECYGGPFRVYSTKEFPGLQASTELTKQLARWGVRLNIRETERRRRKKRTPSPPYGTPGKDKQVASEAPSRRDYESDDD